MNNLKPLAARLARIVIDFVCAVVGIAAAFAIGGWSASALVLLAVAVLATIIAFIIIMREIFR